jgi:hypothetical protein
MNELSPKHRFAWQEIEAHVFSVHHTKKVDLQPEHHAVTYSYTVGGELYLGDFRDYAPACSISRGDKLTVLYNPRDPQQNRVPRPNSFGWKQILSIISGALLLLFKFAHGLIPLFFHWLFH